MLLAGEDLQIKFDRDEDRCNWDVRSEYKDGSYGEVDNVNFCSVSDVTFH